jgi:hypothetical protein
MEIIALCRTPMPNNVMEFLNSKPEGPHKLATILASCSPLIAMNGACCRDANLPFEPLMRPLMIKLNGHRASLSKSKKTSDCG